MIFKLRGVISVMRRIHTRWLVLALVMTIALVSASFTGLVRATNDRVDSSSRLVTIYDHELEKTIITKSRTVKQALSDAKIRVGRHDQVSPKLFPPQLPVAKHDPRGARPSGASPIGEILLSCRISPTV